MASRSRLVAAMMRTSTFRGRVLPRGSNSPALEDPQDLGLGGRLAVRRFRPGTRCPGGPGGSAPLFRRLAAPVKAPFSWPKSSLSSRVSGRAAQLTTRKVPGGGGCSGGWPGPPALCRCRFPQQKDVGFRGRHQFKEAGNLLHSRGNTQNTGKLRGSCPSFSLRSEAVHHPMTAAGGGHQERPPCLSTVPASFNNRREDSPPPPGPVAGWPPPGAATPGGKLRPALRKEAGCRSSPVTGQMSGFVTIVRTEVASPAQVEFPCGPVRPRRPGLPGPRAPGPAPSPCRPGRLPEARQRPRAPAPWG